MAETYLGPGGKRYAVEVERTPLPAISRRGSMRRLSTCIGGRSKRQRRMRRGRCLDPLRACDDSFGPDRCLPREVPHGILGCAQTL